MAAKKILIVSGHGNSDPGAVGNGTTERDFIRQYIAPNVVKYLKSAGHDVHLYGGSKQNQNLFVDTQYGAGYGMYWVKAQKFDVVVELHLDAAGPSASGGHVIISSAYPADKIDKDIDAMLRRTVGTIRGIDPRNNLLNANVSGQLNINYRLVELGFITSKKDMDYLKKNYMAFSKDLASAIHGSPIGGTTETKKPSTSSTPSKPTTPSKPVPKTVWGWRGKFTPNTTIKVRKSPGLNGAVVDKGSWLYSGDWVNFDQVIKKDGYWWIRFKYVQPGSSKKHFYCAVCKITDKKERIKQEKYWGKINWK